MLLFVGNSDRLAAGIFLGYSNLSELKAPILPNFYNVWTLYEFQIEGGSNFSELDFLFFKCINKIFLIKIIHFYTLFPVKSDEKLIYEPLRKIFSQIRI